VSKQYKRLGLDPLQQLFVAAFDGDPISTQKRIAVDGGDGFLIPTEEEARSWVRCDWFTEALRARSEREAKFAAQMRRDDMRFAVADRAELQALWTAIARGEQVPMVDPDTKQPLLDKQGKPRFHDPPSMRDRLAASKMLADSLGMNTQVVVHEGGEKPIVVQKVDLEERVKMFRTITGPTEAWLQ
jgi:hypothetical protein